MTKIICETYDHTRLAGAECTTEFFFSYYAPMMRGEPLSEEILSQTPDPYYINPPEAGDLPDMFDGKRVWTVSSRVKKTIEQLEPGIHTFIPVNIRIRRSREIFDAYYLLYVGQFINAVDISKSIFRDGRGEEGFTKTPVLAYGGAAVEQSKIKDHHVWRGGRGKIGGGGDPFSGYLFCSDELADQLITAGAEGWAYIECISVDRE